MSTTLIPAANSLCDRLFIQVGVTITEVQGVPCLPATTLASSSAGSTLNAPQTPAPASSTLFQTASSAASASLAANTAPDPVLSTGYNITISPATVPSQPGNDTTAAPTAAPSTGRKGLGGGAVAGVAIGMLLAGALIAGIIFFFLLRRQKRRQAMSAAAYSRQRASYTERNVGPEKGATVIAAPVGSIDELLPQPAEDNAITGDLSKIRDNIKNHARTYHHSGPISAADVNESSIRDIAVLTGSSATTIIKALSEPLTRDNALRSIIASVILTRCTGERSPSLLPNEVAALSASISLNNGNSSKSVLFSKWKTITAALLSGKLNQDPGRPQSFQDTVASLDSILAPFIKGSVDGGQRRKNLDMILTRTANFAFLLFSQPGTFRFDFASRQGGLTVFPALVQTVGDQGQPLDPIKVLTEKEVVPT